MGKNMFAGRQKTILVSLFMIAFMSTFAFAPTCATASSVRIQLCMVIDGSTTISNTEWNLTVQAVSKGVTETIPHDGSIELTVVQFGYSGGLFARTEVAPRIIDDASYLAVADQVLGIPKMGGSTPTAFGVYLGWQEMRNSPNFATTARQVINLATDNKPNIRNDNATIDLDGDNRTDGADDLIAVVNNAVGQGLDELDIEGINLIPQEKDWFRDWVVRPQPGAIAPPFSKTGWIRYVADVSEFADTLGRSFKPLSGVRMFGLLTP